MLGSGVARPLAKAEATKIGCYFGSRRFVIKCSAAASLTLFVVNLYHFFNSQVCHESHNDDSAAVRATKLWQLRATYYYVAQTVTISPPSLNPTRELSSVSNGTPFLAYSHFLIRFLACFNQSLYSNNQMNIYYSNVQGNQRHKQNRLTTHLK